MKEIKLTQGKCALVDDEDFERLNWWKWCVMKAGKVFYAVRSFPHEKGRRLLLMHHEIIGRPPKGFEVDHENNNGLWNLKSNLRFVTKRQNQQNQKNRNKSSQYPGVCRAKKDKKWRANIQINGMQTHLGLFLNEKEAFKAYCQAVETIGEKVLEGAIL